MPRVVPDLLSPTMHDLGWLRAGRTLIPFVLITLCVSCGDGREVSPEPAAPAPAPPERPSATAFLREHLTPIQEILAPNPREMIRDVRLRGLVAGLFDFDDDRAFDGLVITEVELAYGHELLDVFHRGVVLVLLSELLHYEEVGIDEAAGPDGDRIVTMRYHLESGRPPHVAIQYRMRPTPDGWRVVDLTINQYHSTVEGAVSTVSEHYAGGGTARLFYDLWCSPQVLTVEPSRGASFCPPIEWPGWPEPGSGTAP